MKLVVGVKKSEVRSSEACLNSEARDSMDKARARKLVALMTEPNAAMSKHQQSAISLRGPKIYAVAVSCR